MILYHVSYFLGNFISLSGLAKELIMCAYQNFIHNTASVRHTFQSIMSVFPCSNLLYLSPYKWRQPQALYTQLHSATESNYTKQTEKNTIELLRPKRFPTRVVCSLKKHFIYLMYLVPALKLQETQVFCCSTAVGNDWPWSRPAGLNVIWSDVRFQVSPRGDNVNIRHARLVDLACTHGWENTTVPAGGAAEISIRWIAETLMNSPKSSLLS